MKGVWEDGQDRDDIDEDDLEDSFPVLCLVDGGASDGAGDGIQSVQSYGRQA